MGRDLAIIFTVLKSTFPSTSPPKSTLIQSKSNWRPQYNFCYVSTCVSLDTRFCVCRTFCARKWEVYHCTARTHPRTELALGSSPQGAKSMLVHQQRRIRLGRSRRDRSPLCCTSPARRPQSYEIRESSSRALLKLSLQSLYVELFKCTTGEKDSRREMTNYKVCPCFPRSDKIYSKLHSISSNSTRNSGDSIHARTKCVTPRFRLCVSLWSWLCGQPASNQNRDSRPLVHQLNEATHRPTTNHQKKGYPQKQ